MPNNQAKQRKSEIGISFKVNNDFYKKVKIQATEEEKTIKDFIIELMEQKTGTKNK
jgi:flagellar basal body-associated protein FliL